VGVGFALLVNFNSCAVVLRRWVLLGSYFN
jgi:hypothetical protein